VFTSFKPRDVDGQGGTTSKLVSMLKAYSVFNVAQLENSLLFTTSSLRNCPTM
jgi:antirestriction protein ArdC